MSIPANDSSMVRDEGWNRRRSKHAVTNVTDGTGCSILSDIVKPANSLYICILYVVYHLTVFFGDDEHLMVFASWLKLTAKYCAIYELSR